MLPWLRGRAAGRVLNLFAYTGLVTLALAAAGSEVDPCRFVAADGRLGPAQRRALGLADPPDPLDRR